MSVGVSKRIGYAAAALMLAISGSIFAPRADASANTVGGVTGRDGDTITVEMYVEAESRGYNVTEIDGVSVPEGTDRVEKEISSEYAKVLSYDRNEDECFVYGLNVGSGVMTCKYLDENDELLQTVVINAHVFADPISAPNPATGEDLEVSMMTGSKLNLADVVGDYFDNPANIRPEVCADYDEEEGPAFEISGDSVANAVITAGDEVTAGTVCFRTAYSTEYEEIAYLPISVFEKPELKDVTLAAYGEEADKSVTFELEDDSNVPPYVLTSSDEGIVSVEENEDGEYELVARGVGEATITVTYDTYAKPTQTFKVTVNETVESGVYTELATSVLSESIVGDTTGFENAKKATGDKILGYYEVDLLVKNDQTDAVIDSITEAGSARKVVLPYPTEMPELADGYTRVYYVIRDHDGVKDILPAYDNGDGENFYFYSDKFSAFALAYYDVVTTTTETVASTTGATTTVSLNPNTLDNVMSYMMAAGAAAMVMAGAIVYLMKREA